MDVKNTADTAAVAPVALSAAEAAPWLRAYRDMVTIRLFEENVNQLYTSARMPGLAHLYSGQEAMAVGVCSALNRDDYITSTHRGHGHCLAKGASVDRMYAELLGKAAGYCGGKGGSMHIADQTTGNLGANAIVGGSAGIATGAAFSAKFRGASQVSVCFFGDGALGQGILYEVMNMASLWQLPVIYVCEDNLYNEYTHNRETTAGSMRRRAEAFGIPAEEVDGQNVRDVHAAASILVERARNGRGPGFLLGHTYRWYGHHVGDVNRAYYRSPAEEEEWKTRRDPIRLLGDWLLERAPELAADLERLSEEASDEVASGVRFGLDAAYPELEEVDRDVYA